MKWSTVEIKSLRLKLGWSAANMARRLKVSTDELRSWEGGDSEPNTQYCAEFEKLNIYLSNYSELIKNSPQIDCHLDSEVVEQIVHADFNIQIKI